MQIAALEAATGGVLCKKAVLEISQNSQENSFARIYFWIKLHAYESGQDSVKFVKFLRTLFLQIFTEHLWTTISATPQWNPPWRD